MTAETFLASFLGCLLAFVTLHVAIRTVYVPVLKWLADRRVKKMDQSGVFAKLANSADPADREASFVASMERHHATQTLLIAAIDQDEQALLDAAKRYRAATTPQEAELLRSVRHLFTGRPKIG